LKTGEVTLNIIEDANMKKGIKLTLKEMKIAFLQRMIDVSEVIKSVFTGKKPRI